MLGVGWGVRAYGGWIDSHIPIPTIVTQSPHLHALLDLAVLLALRKFLVDLHRGVVHQHLLLQVEIVLRLVLWDGGVGWGVLCWSGIVFVCVSWYDGVGQEESVMGISGCKVKAVCFYNSGQSTSSTLVIEKTHLP